MLNNFSNTVVFQKPSQRLIKKWQLAVFENWAHMIVMQNIGREKIDIFINELLLEEGLLNNAEHFQLQPVLQH
jgi:histidine decarboxylase